MDKDRQAIRDGKAIFMSITQLKKNYVSKADITDRIAELEKLRDFEYDLYKKGKSTQEEWKTVRDKITGAKEGLNRLLEEKK